MLAGTRFCLADTLLAVARALSRNGISLLMARRVVAIRAGKHRVASAGLAACRVTTAGSSTTRLQPTLPFAPLAFNHLSTNPAAPPPTVSSVLDHVDQRHSFLPPSKSPIAIQDAIPSSDLGGALPVRLCSRAWYSGSDMQGLIVVLSGTEDGAHTRAGVFFARGMRSSVAESMLFTSGYSTIRLL